MSASLESLFERYSARGELAALGEVFDRTSGGLLALAVHLVHDPVEAEDLVQATFLASIEGAASFQAGRKLEPWLAGILARQAARVWRRRGRASEAQAEVEADPHLDPSYAAERRELSEALGLALVQLAPRERELLRRYLAGETPLELARSQGRGAGAVRMQLLRGIEKLRRLLPAGLHALVPLARLPRGLEAVRGEVLAHAGGTAVLATAAIVPVSLGVLVMSTKVVVSALALSALVLVSLRALDVDEGDPATLMRAVSDSAGEGIEVGEAAVAPAVTQHEEKKRESVPALSPVADLPAPEPKRDGLWLVGDLLGLEGVDPTETEIRVRAQGTSVLTRGRADGTFELDVNPLGPRSPDGALLQVYAIHPAWRRVRTEARIDDALRARLEQGYTELRCDLDLSARTSVVGHVLHGDPQAALVRGGERVVSNETLRLDDGAFALYPPEPGEYELLLRVEGRLPLRLPVEVAEHEILDVGFLELEEAGVSIEGEFVARDLMRPGIALAAWRTDIALEEDSFAGVGMVSGRVRGGEAEVDGDGRFRFTGLEPGAYTLSLASRLGGERIQLDHPELEVRAPASGIEFGRELGLVRIGLRGSVGVEPLRLLLSYAVDPGAAEVRYQSFGMQLGGERPVEVLVDRRREFSATVEAQGALAAWRTIPAGRARVHEEFFEPPASAPRFGALELAWSLPDGLQLARGLRAYWRTETDSGNVETVARDGGCRFERLLPGRYELIVVPFSAQFWEPLPSFAGTRSIVVEIEAERTTQATVEWLLGGRARFVPEGVARAGREAFDAEVRDAFGRRCEATFAMREYDAEGNLNVGSFATLPLLWPSELEPNLPPGSYTLVVFDEGRELARIPFAIVAGELVDVPVHLPD